MVVPPSGFLTHNSTAGRDSSTGPSLTGDRLTNAAFYAWEKLQHMVPAASVISISSAGGDTFKFTLLNPSVVLETNYGLASPSSFG